MKPTLGMGLLEYWHHVGTRRMLDVIAAAGTTRLYMRKLAYYDCKPGPVTAEALCLAASQITPAARLDIELLLAGKCRKRPAIRRGLIQPSPEYLAAAAADGVPA